MRGTRTAGRTVAGLAGLAVAALVGLAGCGDGDGDDDDPEELPAATATVTGGVDGGQHQDGATPSPDGSPTAEPDALFEFEIADGQAGPPLDRATVARGSAVRIVVTSDVADEVHLHGYDLAAHLEPGQPGVIEFTADQSGLFELETHEAGLVLLQLVVE